MPWGDGTGPWWALGNWFCWRKKRRLNIRNRIRLRWGWQQPIIANEKEMLLEELKDTEAEKKALDEAVEEIREKLRKIEKEENVK